MKEVICNDVGVICVLWQVLIFFIIVRTLRNMHGAHFMSHF